MRKFILVLVSIVMVGFAACFDDSGSSSDNPAGTGILEVTVSTGNKLIDVEAYPQVGFSWDGDATGLWYYPEVGGDTIAAAAITAEEIGTKKLYVYLFADIGTSSKDYPVLYNGETDTNGGTVRIENIAEGEYYVVVFYDYASGSKLTNLLNRYDRYAFYVNDPSGYETAPYSTPLADQASKILIQSNQTVSIAVKAKKDWLLGTPNDGEGRFFLQTGDPTPTP